MTRPDRRYSELGSLTATGYAPNETAKMHNALRSQAAPLGADAVVITASGQLNDGWSIKQWANAVAIKWQ
jgi:hypothetical protein